MTPLFQSLRWRIQAWHALLLLLVIVAAVMPSWHFARESLLRQIDDDLERMERELVRTIMKELEARRGELSAPLPLEEFVRLLQSGEVAPPASLLESFRGIGPGSAYFSIRDLDGTVLIESENVPTDMVFVPVSDSEVSESSRSIDRRRELARALPLGLKIAIGRDITPELESLRSMAAIHAGIGFSVWIAGLVGGWWLSGRAIRPIATISHTASRIAEGDLSERIDPRAMDTELAQLSRVLNDTFDRLETAFQRQRQFTADASHELRTPIATLLSETQRLLRRERAFEEYREGLKTCGEIGVRMKGLVESLLLLARQEEETSPVPDSACEVSEVIRAVAQEAAPLAEAKGRTLTLELSEARVHGSDEAIAILMRNLIGNAIDHGGDTIVRCRAVDDEVRVQVEDCGPGIPEDDLPRLFDRFFRVDPARTGGSGHSGLGLAIAKTIVENLHGSLKASNREGGGAAFELRLRRIQ